MRITSRVLIVVALIVASLSMHAQTGWVSANGNTTTSDKVGIGTTVPTQALHVFSTTDANTVFLIENTNSTGSAAAGAVQLRSNVAGLSIVAHGSARTLTRFGRTLGGYSEHVQWAGNGLIIGTILNVPLILGTNNASRLFIEGDGDVGIGTDLPQAKLHVAGNAQFDGTVTGTYIKAHYQDVAEWVPSSDDLAPGTVVVLDAKVGNGVMASNRAYDTTVAGVVSAQPGIILGEEGTSKEQVATTGRVRVKVDASRGPIVVGDLLVTSDIRGYAMRSTPIDVAGTQIHRPGTIVGKALEPLAMGQGEILVLLSLQ